MKHTFEIEFNDSIHEIEMDIYPLYDSFERGYEDEICPCGEIHGYDFIVSEKLPPEIEDLAFERATTWALENIKN